MKKKLIGILIFLSCIVVPVLGFYACFVNTDRTLAENIQISSEPTEITPEKLLIGRKSVQHISLLIDEYKPDINDPDRRIKLTDGTIVNPRIELVDKDDQVHPLEISGLSWSQDRVEVDFGGIDEMSVPKKRYKTVRISSDKPFRCSVFWKDFNLK